MADKIIATITSKGQITLPAQHRKAWGLKPGDQIAFDPRGGNRFASNRVGSGASSGGSMN
jgi:AbrB family looped-hinge helix DNA binding protein